MELYHYTSVPSLHAINVSNGINEGYLQLSDNTILRKHSWYTTSPSPLGHGLTNGTEILNKYEELFWRQMNGFTNDQILPPVQNKRAVRITIDAKWIQSQPGFHKYTDLLTILKQPKYYALRLGITALAGNKTLTPQEREYWSTHPDLMHDTWYVHNGVLPHYRMKVVEFMEEDGNYYAYDFEKHGRAEMARYGSYSISQDLLKNINSLSDLKYNEGDIFCYYRKGLSPQVCFTHKLQTLSLYLDDPNFVAVKINEEFYNTYGSIFIPWVTTHAEELHRVWRQAESFYNKMHS